MSFHIYAPAGSGVLTEATIPDPRQWTLLPRRYQESSVSLAGTVVRSAWPTDLSSCEPTYEQTMTEAEYLTLQAVNEHATQATWMLCADGRVFEVVMEITKADRLRDSRGFLREVSIKFGIVREVPI